MPTEDTNTRTWQDLRPAPTRPRLHPARALTLLARTHARTGGLYTPRSTVGKRSTYATPPSQTSQSFGPAPADRATGRPYVRILAAPERALELFGWGPPAVEQSRAVHEARVLLGIPESAHQPITERSTPSPGGPASSGRNRRSDESMTPQCSPPHHPTPTVCSERRTRAAGAHSPVTDCYEREEKRAFHPPRRSLHTRPSADRDRDASYAGPVRSSRRER